MELKLKEPIKYGESMIEVLEIRKPKAKDMRKVPKEASTGDILDLAGRLCGQPPSVIDELGMEDMAALLEIVGNFMDVGPKTGKKD